HQRFEEYNWPSPFNLADLNTLVEKLSGDFNPVLESFPNEKNTDLFNWVYSFDQQLKSISAEIKYFATWLSLPPAPERLKAIVVTNEIPTLTQLKGIDKTIKVLVENLGLSEISDDEKQWLSQLDAALQTTSTRARECLATIESLAEQCFDFADMEYSFLYDKSQHLLAIGFNVDSHHRDGSYYDLLASEARLASFVAIAQGKLPQESWFALGRRLTTADNTPVLLSWSGSMFEYLMPCLIMPSYENTLLDETYKGTVKRQIEYGKQQNIPWGISESCYNIVDTGLTYQYRAFGVPGLGFKRGLGLDLVVAPYASVLALMVDPQAACSNLEKLKADGYEGKYGFFESIDFTPARLPRGQSHVLIQTFMVHHQGMSLLSLAYLLLDQPMQKRFELDVQFQTALLLLQEQVPKTTGHYSASTEMEDITPVSSHSQIRILHSPHTPTPEVQLLSNGRYHVMMTNAGGGYSRWKETSVTRWRED
ncbi:MAG: cyclic beta 1-2 glucan synthetase, partial [Marivirga sp.]|nr:cyclic beta 1-2 glucan synthetase [Marivirga sp.]